MVWSVKFGKCWVQLSHHVLHPLAGPLGAISRLILIVPVQERATVRGIPKLLDQGLVNFTCKELHDTYKQYLKEWVWPCSNKTGFVDTEI